MPHERLTIRTSDGECPAYLLSPTDGDGPWPAVIVYMDGVGIRPTLVDMAQRLADAGYVVLLPDIFYRYGPYAPFVPTEVFAGDFRTILGPLMATTDTGSIRSLDELPANDWRHNDQRYSPENMPRNLAIVDAIAGVAASHGVSNAQVALAWLLAQGDDIVPIPGVKRSETMRDSIGASDVVLTDADLSAITAAVPAGGTAGPRYNEAGMAGVRL